MRTTTPHTPFHYREFQALLKVAALLTVATIVSGCSFKGDPKPGVKARAIDPTVWRIVPVRLRVYPASRFIKESNEALLEARVELFDAMDDSLKAGGEFRFEVFLVDQPGKTRSGQPLYVWQQPLLTLADHKEHYDPITRTYRFRLGIQDLKAAQHRVLLRVVYTPIDGDRLTAEAVVGGEQLHERTNRPTQ